MSTIRDGIVKVEGISMKVNLAAVRASSPFFATKLRNGTTQCDIPNTTQKAAQLLLRMAHDPKYIYREEPTLTFAMEVYKLAKLLRCTKIECHLLRYLILRTPIEKLNDFIQQHWNIVDMTKAPDVLAMNFRPFVMTAFPADYLNFILNSIELVATDKTILSVIMEWKLLHPKDPGMELDKLLQHARYDVLTPKEKMVLELKGGCKLTSARLGRLVENNRRSLAYIKMMCSLPPDIEPIHRISMPDYQYRGFGPRDGSLVMTMWIDQKFIDSWSGEMSLLRRYKTSVGPFACSVYWSSYQSYLICSVTIDRRLSGDVAKQLDTVLSEYEVYVTVLCKTAQIEWDQFETRVRSPAVEAIPKESPNSNLAPWQTVSTTLRVMRQHDAARLWELTNSNSLQMDLLVDICIGRPKPAN